MVVTLKYTYSETLTQVVVNVDIEGVPRKNLDVLGFMFFFQNYILNFLTKFQIFPQVTSCYLKINAPPYVLSLDLSENVVEDKSEVRFLGNLIEISLQKVIFFSYLPIFFNYHK